MNETKVTNSQVLRAVVPQDRPFRDASRARAAAILRDVETLVNIPTGPGSGDGLDKARALFAQRLGALGAELTLIPPQPREAWLAGPNLHAVSTPPPVLVARKRAGAPNAVLLCGHLDTVHPASSNFHSFAIAADGLTATGPGAVDMKAGLLIALHALELLETHGLDLSWGFILNSDEETGSYHSAAAIEAQAAEGYAAGLVFEPAMHNGGLVVARPGSGQFMIECTGKGGHVGRDFRSCISAVTRLGECIIKVASFADPDHGAIVNIGPLQGGDATNIVPDYAAAWGNVRFEDETIGRLLGEKLDALTSVPGALPGTRVLRSFHRPAKPLTLGSAALAHLAQNTAVAIGQTLPFGTTGGVCDGNNLQRAGLATIDTLGSRGGGLHTTSEWIEIASLMERIELAATLMARIHAGELARGQTA